MSPIIIIIIMIFIIFIMIVVTLLKSESLSGSLIWNNCRAYKWNQIKWNHEMLVFGESGKLVHQEENILEQSREPTNSTRICMSKIHATEHFKTASKTGMAEFRFFLCHGFQILWDSLSSRLSTIPSGFIASYHNAIPI